MENMADITNKNDLTSLPILADAKRLISQMSDLYELLTEYTFEEYQRITGKTYRDYLRLHDDMI